MTQMRDQGVVIMVMGPRLLKGGGGKFVERLTEYQLLSCFKAFCRLFYIHAHFRNKIYTFIRVLRRNYLFITHKPAVRCFKETAPLGDRMFNI